MPQHVQAISVNLIPKTGKYILSVRNDGKLPDDNQKFWVSYENEIMIDKDDPLFDTNKRYIIAVRPLITDEEQALTMEYNYDIKFSYTGTHSILSLGIPESGTLHSDYQCFVIQDYNQLEGIYIGKTTVTKSLNLFVNIGGDNFKPDNKEHDFYVRTHEVGVFITPDKISKLCSEKNKEINKEENRSSGNRKCHIYVCLRGNFRDRYTLYYFQQNTPISAKKNEILDLPIPNYEKNLHLVYHPEKKSDLYIEENGINSNVNVYSNCMSQDSAKKLLSERKPVYPDEKNYQKKSAPTYYSRGVFYKSEDFSKITNPVCFISIISKLKCSQDSSTLYCDHGELSLQFSTDLKEIKKSSPTEFILPFQEMKYIYIYNSEPNIPLTIDINTEGNGYLVAFLDKGKEKRPTYQKTMQYLWHWGAETSRFVITKDMISSRGYKDLRGYYVIGMMSRTKPATKAVVTWKHENNRVIYLSNSVGTEISVQNGQEQYAEFRSYFGRNGFDIIIFGGQSDFDIYVKKVDVSKQLTLGEANIFPDSTNYDFSYSIKSRHTIRRLKIPADGSNSITRYLFTFKSKSEFSNFQILIRVKKVPTYIWGSRDVLGYQDSDFNDPEKYSGTFKKGSFLQVDITRPATLSLTPIFPSKDSKGNPKSHDIRIHLNKGYNFIDVAKQISKVEKSHRMMFYGGFFHHYNFRNFNREYMRIFCNGPCEYKMKIIDPEADNYIYLNKFTQGVIPSTFKSIKYSFYLQSSYYQNLVIKARVLRAYKIINNVAEYVPFEMTEEIAKKSISVSYSSLSFIRFGGAYTIKYNKFDNLKYHVRNNEVYIHLKPMRGRYRIEINSHKDYEVKFELEASTDDFVDLREGSMFIDKINLIHPKEAVKFMDKKQHKIVTKEVEDKDRLFGLRNYEYEVKEPGKVKIQLHRCFGKFSLEAKGPGGAQYEEEEVESRSGERVFDVEKPGKLYIKLKTTNENVFEKYKRAMVKNLNYSVFHIEAKEELTEDPFKNIKTGRIAMSFSGSKPTLNFEDLYIPEENFKTYNYKIKYTSVSTIMPELLEYYNGCNSIYLKDMFNDHFKKHLFDEYLIIKTVEVVLTSNKHVGPMSTVRKEISWFKDPKIPVHQIEMDLASGERYHASVFADLIATPKSFDYNNDIDYSFDLNQQHTRIHYKTIRFDTSTFAAPIEMISAIVGLIAIVVISCGLVGKTITGFVAKLGGFQALQSNADDSLESHFLKLKKQGELLEAGETIPNEEGEYAVEEVSNRKKKNVEEESKTEEQPPKNPAGENQNKEIELKENKEEKEILDEEDIEKEIEMAQKRYGEVE